MGEELDFSRRAVDELIRLLGDPDAKVRVEARHQLSGRGKEAILRLAAALELASEDVRFEVSRTLTEMGEAAIEPMLKAILHPSVHVREAAARVLSLIGDEDARRRLDEAAQAETRKTVRKELREASAKIERRLETSLARERAPAAPWDEEPHLEPSPKQRDREEKHLYFSIVQNLILSNWARPRRFGEAPVGEEVLVTLKVDRDGSVSRVLIENKWQNTQLGESLKDAIRRSSPLPQVPDVVAGGRTEVDLTFILKAPR